MDYSFLDQIPGAVRKPEPRKRMKGRKLRVKQKNTREVRPYVFARERDICRCCRFRAAESMHELTPKSRGGKVSKFNSVAVCGDGVRGCHGFLQRHEIDWACGAHFGPEGPVWFQARTKAAAEWMRITLGATIESPVMRETEDD